MIQYVLVLIIQATRTLCEPGGVGWTWTWRFWMDLDPEVLDGPGGSGWTRLLFQTV